MSNRQQRPKCKLIGTDGNVLALAAKVRQTLRDAGRPDKATEFVQRLPDCANYDEALLLMQDYVAVE